jgi:molybdopterin/thiamine biosynthesis adenylyltransferase
MIAVLGLALALWGLGHLLRSPVRLRLTMIGFLWLAVVGLHLVLPDGHPLRLATGTSAQVWLVLGGVLAFVLGYRSLLGRLRARADKTVAPDPAPPGKMSAPELERYARHIMLREIGGAGQKRLKAARVLVIGAGGLGSPALLYLAASGVGTIGVMDDDTVDATNLQRQIIHSDDRIGLPKVQSALEAMKALNPYVTLRPYQRRLDATSAAVLDDYDLILDGSDNFDTRYLANQLAVAAKKPLVSAAITQWEGQISVYDPSQGGPCYECVFPARPAPGMVPTCAEAGVASPLPGIIGAMMAMEAVKVLTGAGESLRGRLMIYDALYAEARVIGMKPRADCPICAARP